jgi:hypothetical protein
MSKRDPQLGAAPGRVGCSRCLSCVSSSAGRHSSDQRAATAQRRLGFELTRRCGRDASLVAEVWRSGS